MTVPSTDKTTKTWVLLLTSAASFMAILDAMVVTTALGSIRRDLGASIELLQWTVNAYNLSFAVLLLTGAALGDRFGRRRIFIAGIATFLAASVICAVGPSAAWLIAGRALQGVGAALLMPLAMALLSAAFPPEERARALGIFGGINGIALILGPIVGGAIAEGLAWQWIFWINIPIGLVLLPLARRRIAESFGPRARLDIAGVLLVTGSALALVWALMRGNRLGWTHAEVVGSLVSAVVLAIGFIARERQAREPMVPLRLFRSRAFTAGILASFLFYAGMYGVLFLLPQFLQTAQGHGALGVGLRLLPWTAPLFVFAPLGGSLVNRLGERALVVTGVLLQGVCLAWIGLVADPALPFVQLAAPLLISGAGVSAAMPAVQNAILGAVARSEIGKASGIFNMVRFLGGTFGVAMVVAVFSSKGGIGSPEAFTAGFVPALAIAALLSLLSALAGMALPGRRALSLAAAKQQA
ncbi:MAG TPA: DHA2 family efflux MFS transporter permease subunit [Stellaceae bacterium]|nr:DHA2 family efflux MFS transporter permease subunit [Stellaceae bacterium]